MREVIPVIIRLLADSAHPPALRGTLQTLNQEDPQPFGDEQELLMLLYHLVGSTHTMGDESGQTPDRP